MLRKKVIKRLIAIAYTLAVTVTVGRWAIYAAYFERGYMAVGGEYCLIIMVCWIAWKAINYLIKTLEDLDYEQNCKERRG